jgi:hypothetical protein
MHAFGSLEIAHIAGFRLDAQWLPRNIVPDRGADKLARTARSGRLCFMPLLPQPAARSLIAAFPSAYCDHLPGASSTYRTTDQP